MRIALVNARVLTPGGFSSDKALLIEAGRISAVLGAADACAQADAVHDLDGKIVAPGFIDCQVNGGGGVLFNDAPTPDTIRRIGAAHARFGTSGFLPTLISDDPGVMRAAIAAVDAAIDAGVPGVLGIHLEGPYLAPGRRGIHNAAKFLVPQAGDIELASSLRRGRTLLTLAPERVGAGFLADLCGRGVIVAAGHSAADYAATRAALDAGLRGFTHLFNAMTPMQSREPGVVGAALEDRASWCGVIADGHHVHPAVLRVAIAAKARGKMLLVTDAMPPVGADMDRFVLNGAAIRCCDGRCVDASGTLAGSVLDMATAVRNIVAFGGVAVDEALRMASTYPADFLRLENRGRLAAGCAADWVVLDDALEVVETWIDGRCVFRSGAAGRAGDPV